MKAKCFNCERVLHVTCLCNGWGVVRPVWNESLETLAAASTVAVELLERAGYDADSEVLAKAVRVFVMGYPFRV